MSDMGRWLLLIPLLPLIAAAAILFFGEAYLRRHSHWPCVLAIGGACVLSFLVLAYVRSGSRKENAGLERVITAVEEDPKADHFTPARRVLGKLG